MREVRQREDDGHQVSVLATDYRSELASIAVRMFARWTQENFLKYMREHFAIDRVVEHRVEALPADTIVVNPTWRRLDTEVRREQARLAREQAQFGALSLSPAPEPTELEDWQAQKARLYQAVITRQARVDQLRAERKAVLRHVALGELPADEQFPRLQAQRKHLVDTINLIAYRAETALVGTVRETLARRDDARALVRELLRTTADLRRDPAQKTLTVRLHPLGAALQDAAVRHLADELTATESVFPGTDLCLIFTLPDPA